MTPGVKSLRAALRLSQARAKGRAVSQALSPQQIQTLLNEWRLWARPDQLPPQPEAWRNWLILGGRGAGKTRAGAEFLRAKALGLWGPPVRQLALIGPSLGEARAVMVEGPSGLLAIHAEEERPDHEPSKRLITWPNGAVAQVFSADEPESLRGPQFELAWCDELAKWSRAAELWAQLQFALRLGENPRAVITTTPRPTALLKQLLADPATVTSRATTFANAANLAPAFIKDVEARYGGTRLGRQELLGELIEDDPDALFKRADIERLRVALVPELLRIVVAVDPPASHHAKSNACGIVMAGVDRQGHCFVLADASLERARPRAWADKVVALWRANKASRVVAEVNQGGAMVEAVLRQAEPNLPFRAVHARLAKRARAEPVAALYERGLVHHAGSFPALEDEMCAVIEDAKSPDRLDALVWALTDLMLSRNAHGPRVRVV
ncbi:MAG: DNA-packaging protein [Alphaproteobacteria bacterium]|nr:DNA-packaging protein [Alphaproteobacteria bacterium]